MQRGPDRFKPRAARLHAFSLAISRILRGLPRNGATQRFPTIRVRLHTNHQPSL